MPPGSDTNSTRGTDGGAPVNGQDDDEEDDDEAVVEGRASLNA
jgi:hypothetical protein